MGQINSYHIFVKYVFCHRDNFSTVYDLYQKWYNLEILPSNGEENKVIRKSLHKL